nr:hypothetical protein [Bacillus subtilis]
MLARGGNVIEEEKILPNDDYSEPLINQDKLLNNVGKLPVIGMVVSSHCKRVITKKDDGNPKSKEEERFGVRM